MALMCALVFQRRLHLVPLGCDVNQAVMNIDFYFFYLGFSHIPSRQSVRGVPTALMSAATCPLLCAAGGL